ncbi:hypothetical protein [Streptomyces sp. NPDC005141]
MAGEVRPASQREERRISTLLRKTLLTVLVASSTWALTNVLFQDKNQVWQLTVSVVLGGAALIIQYLVDVGKRLEAMEEGQTRRIREMRDSLSFHHLEIRAAVDENFARINDATELFSQVDRAVPRSDGMIRLARRYTQVGHQGSEIVKTFAQEEIGRLASLMESLSNGSVDCPGENHDWLIDLTTCVKRTLYATSTSLDWDFWCSEPANRLLAAQGQAIKRGAEVRRLFLVDEESEITESLQSLCAKQRMFGIDARIAVRSQLEPSARVAPLNDFAIFDGELCYETEPELRFVPSQTTLNTVREHVQERINRFNTLWHATEPESKPVLLGTSHALPTDTSPSACRLRLTLLDDHPAPRTPVRIQLRVQPGPEHPWSEPGAECPPLTAVAIPLTPAVIEPVSVSLRPWASGDDGAAEVLFTAELAGTHRICVTVHDWATGTVLQQVETTVHVTGGPGEHPPAPPFALHTDGE